LLFNNHPRQPQDLSLILILSKACMS